MKPKDAGKKQIEALVKSSQKTSRGLEHELLKIMPHIVDRTDKIYILIATFDLENGLAMAPVTNIGKKLLKQHIDDKLLLYYLRNNLAFSNVGSQEPSTARWLLDELKKVQEKSRNSHIGLVRITPYVESRAQIVDLTKKAAQVVTRAIPEDTNRIAPNVKSMARDLSQEERVVDLVVACFDVKPIRDTVVTFAHLGLWAVPNTLSPEEIELQYPKLLRLICYSRMATLSILLERQRYFEKSIRQSVSGHIIKFGEKEDIKTQVEMYKKLAGNQVYVVPAVVDDNVSDEREKEEAWFKMPRYSCPSLMDLFSKTEGFQKFEIESIVTSAFKYLTDKLYSAATLDTEPIDTRDFLLGPLIYTQDAIDVTLNSIIHAGKEILDLKPVKLGRGIEVFHPDYYRYLKKFVDVAQKIDKREAGTIHWRVMNKAKTWDLACELLSLDQLQDDIKNISTAKKTTRFKTENINMHGDAHFGNFLIDASIPESPLIYVIDTRKVRIPGHLIRNTELSKETANLIFDPLYDFAKMLLSCSCGYDLAYREGFKVGSISGGTDGWTIRLRYSFEQFLEKEHDTGGLSNTEIVTLKSGVAQMGFFNYVSASKALCANMMSWLQRELNDDGSYNDESYAVSLVKIWLLTVRHTFSIVGHLFPKYPGRSLAMLCLGITFVANGKGHVASLLSKLCKDQRIPEETVKNVEESLEWVLGRFKFKVHH